MDNFSSRESIKYFAYTRKSSEDSEKQEKSIGSQKKEIQERFPSLEIVEVFEEEASAFKPYNRPVLSEMIRRIEAGEAQGIIAWHPDRLSRNAVDAGQIIYQLDTGKLKDLKFCSYSFENSPEGKMFLGMTMSQSKYFSEKLGKDTKRGLKTKLESGGFIGVAPQGYDNDRLNKTIIKDPERFELMKKCWELLLKKVPVRTILKTLNEDWGFRTKKLKKQGGKPLSLSGLYRTFGSRFCCGWIDLKDGRTYKGNHEPMITEDQYWATQRILGDKGKAKPKTHQFAFTGNIHCGECGCLITAEEKFNRYGSYYVYYHCTKKKIDFKCSQLSVRVENLEQQLSACLLQITIPKSFRDWAIKYLNEENGKEIGLRNASLKQLQGAYNDALQKLDNLLKLKISPLNNDGGLLSDEDYAKQKAPLVEEKSKLEERLNDTGHRASKWLELVENMFNFACYAKHHFDHGTLQEKREVFEGLGSNFILKDGKLNLDLKLPFKYLEMMDKNEEAKPTGFEPEVLIDITAEKNTFIPQKLNWLRGVDSNHQPLA